MIEAVRDLIIAKVHYKNKIGSIVIPENQGGKENVMEYYGEVISVGPTCPYKGDLKAGDKILFSRNEGIKVDEFISLKPRAILGVYNE